MLEIKKIMASINPYITFKGNCEEAFNLYQSVFGGEPDFKRFSEMPSDAEYSMSEEDGNKIMHVAMPIGSTVLMGSDTGGEWSDQTNIGNNISISINADSKENADKIFNGLSAGGNVKMPMEATFWGDYFGMCTDKFDINWMVSFNEHAKG